MTIADPVRPVRAVPARIRMPRPKADKVVVWALLACIAIYYMANAYHDGVAAVLTIAKWPVLALVAVAALVGLARARKVRPASYFIPFLFLAVLSTNLIQSVYQQKSAAVLATIALMIIAARLVAANFDHIALRKRFFDIVLWIGLAVIAVSAPMYVLGLNLGRSMFGRFSGWTDNPNTLGAILAPALVVMIAGILAQRPQWQWRYGLPFLVGSFLLHHTGSRAALLWLAASAMAFWIYRKGVSFGAFAASVLLILFFGWQEQISAWMFKTFTREGLRANASLDTLVSGRGEVWELALMLSRERPLLGYGLGSSTPLIDDHDWFFSLHQGGHFHNSYLTALVETGAVGLIAMSALLIFTLVKGLKEARQLRNLPRQEWPFVALPWVILVGAMVHAIFETWLLSAGNANVLILWICVWMLHENGLRNPAPRLTGPMRPPRQPRLAK